jgi:hypothetical protein
MVGGRGERVVGRKIRWEGIEAQVVLVFMMLAQINGALRSSVKKGVRVVRYGEKTRHAVSISRPIPAASACGWTALRAVPM